MLSRSTVEERYSIGVGAVGSLTKGDPTVRFTRYTTSSTSNHHLLGYRGTARVQAEKVDSAGQCVCIVIEPVEDKMHGACAFVAHVDHAHATTSRIEHV